MKFFAEGLPRLGVVNLQVQLDGPSNETSSISTTEGDVTVTLHNDGVELYIPLPFPPSKTETLIFPPKQSIITSRISTLRSTSAEDPKSLLSAEEFETHYSRLGTLSCVSCHTPIVTTKQLRFKDLPSDSWLEFSDYWLCHPSHSHSHTHTHTHSETQIPPPKLPTIKSNPGTALLGLTSLVLNSKDVQNVTIKVTFPFVLVFYMYLNWT